MEKETKEKICPFSSVVTERETGERVVVCRWKMEDGVDSLAEMRCERENCGYRVFELTSDEQHI